MAERNINYDGKMCRVWHRKTLDSQDAKPLCEAVLQSDKVFLHSHTAPLISSAIKEEQVSIPSKIGFLERYKTNKPTKKQKYLLLTFDIAAGVAITVVCKR